MRKKKEPFDQLHRACYEAGYLAAEASPLSGTTPHTQKQLAERAWRAFSNEPRPVPTSTDGRSTESEPARSLTFEEGERAREFLRERGWRPSGLAWIKEHGEDHAGDIFEALDKEKT